MFRRKKTAMDEIEREKMIEALRADPKFMAWAHELSRRCLLLTKWINHCLKFRTFVKGTQLRKRPHPHKRFKVIFEE
jgi:hypothetical protein